MQSFHREIPIDREFMFYFRPPARNQAGQRGDFDYYQGATVAVLRTPHGYYTGVALCSPKDQFSRKLGRSIAVGRALKGAAMYPGEPDLPLDEARSTESLRIIAEGALEDELEGIKLEQYHREKGEA